jgi:ribosomal protein S18 acetylase RimI-like enzyme
MDNAKDTMRFYVLNELNYSELRSVILNLYLHAFSTGEHAQHIDLREAEIWVDSLVQRGTGIYVLVGDRLAGVVLGLPLMHDKDFPVDRLPELKVEETFYIAELMVHADLRGQGIAKSLIRELLSLIAKTYTNIVIRVWEENKPALSLYTKMGFHPVATITQTKKYLSGESFEMSKIYLHINSF